jgi:hypothetical protein
MLDMKVVMESEIRKPKTRSNQRLERLRKPQLEESDMKLAERDAQPGWFQNQSCVSGLPSFTESFHFSIIPGNY